MKKGEMTTFNSLLGRDVLTDSFGLQGQAVAT